jgi:methionyl-tRNA formyltransferase
MVLVLDRLERGDLALTPQPEEGVTYAAKIDKNETRIDWTKPWQAVHDHCRGLSPFPGAWFELPADSGKSPGKDAVRVKVLDTTKGDGVGAPGTVLDDRLTIACGTGAVRIVELQRAGRQPMKAEEFLRGTPLAAGTRLA